MEGIKMEENQITREFCEFLVGLDNKDIDDKAIHEAKRCLMDWFGVVLGGSTHEGVDIILKTLDELGLSKVATVIGRKEKTDVLHAAFINSYMSHVLDYDDTHLDSFVHPSGPVWAAIVSLSERYPLNGKDALRSFVVGFEAETRIGRVLFRHHDEQGFHMTGMAGGFGAAAAAGRIMGLDVEQLQRAFGIVATYSSGLRAMFGTMSKSAHPAKAAMSGIYAASLAKNGFTSALNVLEAPRGYFLVNAAETDIEEVVEGLGQGFEIMKNSVKPYSCGVVTHPIIDGGIALRTSYREQAFEVDYILAEVNSMVPDVTGKKTPQTGLEGKFSVYHCIAAGLIDGECGPEQFTDSRVQASEIISVRDKIKLEVNPKFKEYEARVSLVLKNGKRITHYVPFALGTEKNGLSDLQIESKYFTMAKHVIGEQSARRLASSIWELDEDSELRKLLEISNGVSI